MKRWTLTGGVVLGALLMMASGEASLQKMPPPIVAIKVTPNKSVFNDSAWNKPLAIKTIEEAGKHFDKEALAVLAKEVDFQKQFLLVFAWKGSGGDKLKYVVAESFPEQIFFSLTPGVTNDLRAHSHVFALRSNVRWSVKSADKGKAPGEGKKDDSKAGTAGIRPLKFVAKDPMLVFRIGGMNKATLLNDAEAVSKLVGEDAARQLTDAVDFKKEAIVLVSWTTSGPPDGKLRYEVKKDGETPRITFYVQAPDSAVRGQRARIGADFFAVPRNAKATLDPKERTK